ncbi:MAG: GTPase Era [Candidatus Melainabacteria bacterium LEY3_CP_29_8]|nr:MAG: GTPase Era [Candidatus Melainabacteria bacterium LEY3_CP_29_8]
MENKCGFVSIVGRPNVGKSTLLNGILGQKIVITSDKAQTTRKRMRGIYTDERGQIVFFDTPGVHKPVDNLGEFLIDEVFESANDTDLIMLLLDASQKIGNGDKWIIKNIIKNKNIVVVFNKIDLVNDKNELNQNICEYKEYFNENTSFVEISAINKHNIENLLEVLFKKLPIGENIYPDDYITDETMRSISCEIIREKVLNNTKDEVPHSVFVNIEKYEENDDIDKIFAVIYVNQDSQKGILIGKNGSMLKKIGTEARCEIEKTLDKKVYLNLNVKVEKNWKKNKKLIKNKLF